MLQQFLPSFIFQIFIKFNNIKKKLISKTFNDIKQSKVTLAEKTKT